MVITFWDCGTGASIMAWEFVFGGGFIAGERIGR